MSPKQKLPTAKKDPYASRWLRLWGAIIDGLILAPLCFAFYRLPDWNGLAHAWAVDAGVLRLVCAAAFTLTLFLLINGWLIYTRGQTVGKAVCGTVVVTKDGQQVSGNRYLFARNFPFRCLGFLGAFGALGALGFISLPLDIATQLVLFADILAIFRRQKNRLADDIAGTRVILRADLKPSQDGKGICTLAPFHLKAMSSLKDKVEHFRDDLIDGNVMVCGNSPQWVREVLLEMIEPVLTKSSDPTFGNEVQSFVAGAIRYIADSCDNECDQLVKSLSELIP